MGFRERLHKFLGRKDKASEPKTSEPSTSGAATIELSASTPSALETVPATSRPPTTEPIRATILTDALLNHTTPPTTDENTPLLDTPATTPLPEDIIPLQAEIWNEAYDGLKEDEPRIVEAYERILSGQLKTGAASAIDVDGDHENIIETASRQDQLKKLLEDGQARTEKSTKVKGKIKGVVEPFDKLRAIISLAVKTEAAASTAWAGITAVLDILASPLLEPGANREGIKYILERAEWYWQLSSILFDPDVDRSLTGVQSSLRESIVRLYKKLLLYQMKSVCLYGRCEAAVIVRDMFKLDDWKSQITAIEDEAERVRRDAGQFGTLHLGSHLKTIDLNLQEVRTDLQAITATIREFGNEERECNERDKDTNFIRGLSGIIPKAVKEYIMMSKGGFIKEAYDLVLQQSNFAALQRDDNTKVIWVTGNPGKGKTMFLCGVIDDMVERQKLRTIAYFFCRADNQDTNTADSVLRGLLYLICDQSPGIARRLRQRFENQRLIQDDSGPASRQLEKMLSEVLAQPSMRRAVLIVDAIDECDPDSIETLFGVLGQLSQNYPAQWIISTRTSHNYCSLLTSGAFDVKPCYLELSDSVVSEAIQVFIRNKVSVLSRAKEYGKYDKDLENHVLRTLFTKSGGTFLWVALVCLELGRLGVQARHTKGKIEAMPEKLSDLYGNMIRGALNSPDGALCSQILPLVCIARRPLTLDELRTVILGTCHLSEEDLVQVLANCGSFLTLQGGKESSKTLAFIHESAREYLTGAAHDQVFPDGIPEQHRSVLRQSLTAIKSLSRDIYQLNTPGISINDINPPEPDPLSKFRYSCLHWLDHAAYVHEQHCWGEPEDGYMQSFIQEDLLHWLEALCLTKTLPQATAGYQKVTMLLRTSTRPVSQDLMNLVEEARRFILYNKICIEMAPLQVYASAILFWPHAGTDKIKDCYQSSLDLVTKYPESVTLSSSQNFQELPCGKPTQIAFSTDGRHLAVFPRNARPCNGVFEVWDVHANHRVQCSALQSPVKAITSSLDGKDFVTVDAGGTIRRLNIDSGKWIDDFMCGFSPIAHARFSPKCQFVALQAVKGDHLIVISLGTKREIQSMYVPHGARSAFSPDETQMITLRGGNVTLWNIGNNNSIWTAYVPLKLRDAAFFGDEHVAVVCGDEPNISIRATKDGSEILVLPCEKDIISIAWLGNGLSFVSLCNDNISIHNETGRECVQRLSIPSSAAFVNENYPFSYSFCHSAQSVAWGGKSAVYVWDMNTPTNDSSGSAPNVPREEYTVVHLSPYTSHEVVLAASHYDNMIVWSRHDGKIVDSILDYKDYYHQEDCEDYYHRQNYHGQQDYDHEQDYQHQQVYHHQQLLFSPNGRHIIVKYICDYGRKKRENRIFDTKRGMVGGRLGNSHRVSVHANFSADGDSIAFALGRNGVQVWKLTTQVLTTSISRSANRVQFSHNSRFLAIIEQRHIEIWSLSSPPHHLQTIDIYDESFAAVAFSPDDKRLMIATSGSVYVYYLGSNEPSHKLHWSSTLRLYIDRSLALSSDGNFAAVTMGYHVWIWNLNQPESPPLYQELPHGTRTCSFDIHATRLLVDGGAVIISSIPGVDEADGGPGIQEGARYEGYGISEDYKWITRDGQNLLYLPREYRPEYMAKDCPWGTNVSFRDSMVAIALEKGALYLLQF